MSAKRYRALETSTPESESSVPSAAWFELHPIPPYRLDLTVWALRRRRRNEVDCWDGTYRRALLVSGGPVDIRVEQLGGVMHPVLRVDIVTPGGCSRSELAEIRTQVSQLLGVDVDLAAFYDLADADPLTAALKDRFLGLRPPRFPSLFESLANAVANQQLSLEVGLTLLNRLVAEFGTEVPGTNGRLTFPAADAVLTASPDGLRRLGFSARKSEYLHGIAQVVTAGALDVASFEQADRAEATRLLMEIRGVGRWSAEYVLLRGLGRLDVYPGDDVGARNKFRRFFDLDHDPSYDEIAERLRPWDPYSGLLYFHLLLEGLAERGDLDA